MPMIDYIPWKIITTMKEIILKALEEIQDSQINIKSESAREFLANKLEPELQRYFNQILEEVCCGVECKD